MKPAVLLRFFAALALIPLAGCLPDLGDCDESAARAVVYTADLDGFPAYEGQALLHRSCGSGVFCHSEQATGAMRNGAPVNLNFDLALAGPDVESTERLRRGQQSIVDHARQIMATIEGETMPPGEIGETIRDAGPVYDGLPEIETPEGQAIVRNWLACGAPVVERVGTDRPAGVEPVGADDIPAMPMMPPCDLTLCGAECVDTMVDRRNCGGCGMACAGGELCDAGSCVPCTGAVSFSADVQPIFEAYGCDTMGCHSDRRPSAGLDLTTSAAFASLVSVPSTCPDGRLLVTEGEVTASYLVNKLMGVDMCSGGQMPLGTRTGIMPTELQTIEAWICGGALND
jgi:hypothetical protein